MTVLHNIPTQDKLPQNKEDYKRLLIASAYGSSQTNNTDAGNVIDTNVASKWTSKGFDEHITLELPDICTINRIDIMWDPTLTRTGRFSILISQDNNLFDKLIEGTMDTSLYANVMIPAGIQGQYVRIVCNGNAENDLNGITNVLVYGDDHRNIEETKRLAKELNNNRFV
jgi:hypothetical protein